MKSKMFKMYCNSCPNVTYLYYAMPGNFCSHASSTQQLVVISGCFKEALLNHPSRTFQTMNYVGLRAGISI